MAARALTWPRTGAWKLRTSAPLPVDFPGGENTEASVQVVSLQLSEAVLVDVGVPMGLVIASIHERRDEYRAMLKKKETEVRPAFRARRTVGKGVEARDATPGDESKPVSKTA